MKLMMMMVVGRREDCNFTRMYVASQRLDYGESRPQYNQHDDVMIDKDVT